MAKDCYDMNLDAVCCEGAEVTCPAVQLSPRDHILDDQEIAISPGQHLP